MLILGISGGSSLPEEVTPESTGLLAHDGAAVLIEDGQVLAAVEEERLNRIKHSDKAPLRAIAACLELARRELREVAYVAYPYLASHIEHFLRERFLNRAGEESPVAANDVVRLLLGLAFGHDMPADRIRFIRHHLAHAASAYYGSGLDESLILTLDGRGEDDAGLVAVGQGGKITVLRTVPVSESLGEYYLGVIRLLGYHMFDEYKVMGLAPYGDPARFRADFEQTYSLAPDGEWRFQNGWMDRLFEVLRPRRRGEPITQVHKDLAAALQETLERIVFHHLTHWQAQTAAEHLCLAGGVALNCTMNGRILASGLFRSVFVQPAAHDAGAALGAALVVQHEAANVARSPRQQEVFWGLPIAGPDEIGDQLARWERHVTWKRVDDVDDQAARLLAEGRAIGWVQGRSEFGPRALGNRSILADPRPAENKTIINAMVKKREAFRPFAPSVLEERLADWFDVPPGVRELPFMIFVVGVRSDKRQTLGAVTHVDGSARVQSVSENTNPRFWRLLRGFEALTGVPVVLNTSFNNDAEPIVDSVDDAVACFLTTGLHELVVGDYIVSKKERTLDASSSLVPSLLPHMRLVRERSPNGEVIHALVRASSAQGTDATRATISAELHAALDGADGRQSLASLASRVPVADLARLTDEAWDLWTRRFLVLRPADD
jgi:carbamoyltransferase